MIYSPSKIKELFEMIEEHLTEKEQNIIRAMISNYNKLFILAKEKIEYIKRKEVQYAEESKENDKLKQRNKELERDKNMLKKQNKEQRELLKMYRKS